MVERDVGEMPLGALGEDGHSRDEIAPRLEVGQRCAVLVAPLVAGAHTDDPPLVDEQAHGRRLGQEHRALGLGALGKPAADL